MQLIQFVPLGMPVYRIMNNGILKSKNAMPFKDITSDGDASFRLNRKLYQKTAVVTSSKTTITIGRMVIQRNALGLANQQSVISGPATPLQKRWIGGNHDASQIVKNRRVNAIGQTDFNVSGKPFSFKTVVDNNTQRQARHRMRNGGSAVPAQKIHKYVNAPVFY
jgi:hypothetical protein